MVHAKCRQYCSLSREDVGSFYILHCALLNFPDLKDEEKLGIVVHARNPSALGG